MTTRKHRGTLAPRHRAHALLALIAQVAFNTSAIQRCTMRCRLAPAQTSSISMMLALFSTAARPGSVSTLEFAGIKLILLGASNDCIAGLVAHSISFFPASGFF